MRILAIQPAQQLAISQTLPIICASTAIFLVRPAQGFLLLVNRATLLIPCSWIMKPVRRTVLCTTIAKFIPIKLIIFVILAIICAWSAMAQTQLTVLLVMRIILCGLVVILVQRMAALIVMAMLKTLTFVWSVTGGVWAAIIPSITALLAIQMAAVRVTWS